MDFQIWMLSCVFRKPEHFLQGLVVMPRRDYGRSIRNVPKIVSIEVCHVHRVVPRAAVDAPSHHVKATGVDQPSAHKRLPLGRDGHCRNYNHAERLVRNHRQGRLRCNLDIGYGGRHQESLDAFVRAERPFNSTEWASAPFDGFLPSPVRIMQNKLSACVNLLGLATLLKHLGRSRCERVILNYMGH